MFNNFFGFFDQPLLLYIYNCLNIKKCIYNKIIMNNINKVFWDNYYKTNNHDILKPSSFSSFVYESYIEKYNKDNIYLNILDLGSGNCRDTIFFSSKKNVCYGLDINGVLHY